MGISGRIARFFLDSQLTPLIALVALLLGLFAVLVTPREEEPQINVTMANVFIPFPGASARDVEALVSTPAEQVLSRISGIDHVYSVSRPGMAVLTAQFKVGIAHETAVVRLMDTIQSRRDWVSAEPRGRRTDHQAHGHRRCAGGYAHALDAGPAAWRVRPGACRAFRGN